MPETPEGDPLIKAIGMLRTAVDELARLSEHPMVKTVVGSLISALREDGGPRPATPAATAVPPAAPQAPPVPSVAEAAPDQAARPASRREDLLGIIERNPGTSVAAAARDLGIAAGGLYPVARKLESDGLIRKEGKGWHLAS